MNLNEEAEKGTTENLLPLNYKEMYYKNVLNQLTFYRELISKIGSFFLYIKKYDRKQKKTTKYLV